MRPLTRSSLCTGCAHYDRCTGLFEPKLEDDPFTRDDARVRAVVAALEGDVLDLGCGEGPYEELLAPSAMAGRIRYVGVDPHASLDALRARWPWATLIQGDAETVPLDRLFDHVLILRSWNHLKEPESAIRRIVKSLRPQGELIVVDNVAFGLARTRPQTSTAVRSTAIFEHYRNDGAEEAHQIVLRGAPELALIERMDVGLGTANQWLLRYRRAW